MSRYRYAGYSPKGRHHGQRLDMREIMHVIFSLQMLFGSRRGGSGLLLLIIVIGAVAYFGFMMINDPTKALAKADLLWARDDKVGAIHAYKQLLRKRAPLGQDGAAWLQDSRPRLYRRIISFEAEYGDSQFGEVRDWIVDAWNNGIRNLKFESEAAQKLWDDVTADIDKSATKDPFNDLIQPNF